MSEKVKHPVLWATLFTIISLAWVFPIVLVVINSFKQKAYISRNAFSIPTGKAFVGLQNYTRGIKRTNLIESFGWTVVVTVGAVLLILLCTSMCAWWIVRVNNRTAKSLYLLFLFNMIVPFQMVMFTLSKIADMLGLNTPWGLWIVYLGFGAGLAVFIFTGVIKGIPQELEESAMIDGQYLKGGYGSVDMGAMMGCLVLAIIPIIIFYLVCQKYIIKGVMAGAVKG